MKKYCDFQNSKRSKVQNHFVFNVPYKNIKVALLLLGCSGQLSNHCYVVAKWFCLVVRGLFCGCQVVLGDCQGVQCCCQLVQDGCQGVAMQWLWIFAKQVLCGCQGVLGHYLPGSCLVVARGFLVVTRVLLCGYQAVLGSCQVVALLLHGA